MMILKNLLLFNRFMRVRADEEISMKEVSRLFNLSVAGLNLKYQKENGAIDQILPREQGSTGEAVSASLCLH